MSVLSLLHTGSCVSRENQLGWGRGCSRRCIGSLMVIMGRKECCTMSVVWINSCQKVIICATVETLSLHPFLSCKRLRGLGASSVPSEWGSLFALIHYVLHEKIQSCVCASPTSSCLNVSSISQQRDGVIKDRRRLRRWV